MLGANGFIGSAVMKRMASQLDSAAIGLVRTDSAARELNDKGMNTAIGDINDIASLQDAMSEASTVISCISYVGDDEQRCFQVNQQGMRNVASIASKVGVQRLLYVSTAAVYGPGPFRDLPVDSAPIRPQSVASRTRAVAEQCVRDSGGLVIRPHLVYGVGDRWFLPTLTEIVTRLGAVIDGGKALQSVVDVSLFARSICRLSMEQQFRYGTILHVNEPAPMKVIDILRRHSQETSWNLPRNSITRVDALKRATDLGLTVRHIDMISMDHWFRSCLY
ncbi:NAD-dependent epimerase/dehydratase family protein [Rhodococcus sp. H29-C3]|uniref:NAD-dependent epimerase/dehydratase family protein n=1 Tax=Rhodococcus sp. H29-C3 TaxID=3046307 RepID=UPI0024B9B187|nr:NAD-dependent epimerase/dehydratase family protein [Rhodococcus sp. H29-C3]MDJ0362293.1 NAD-dependent epimerase/dehydratase family protein [Rhodococcus sp. H29-C3]